MNHMPFKELLFAFILSCPLGAAALGGEFDAVSGTLRGALTDSRQGGDNTSIAPTMVDMAGKQKGAAAAPKDDLKKAVVYHLGRTIAYCDKHMDDCNGDKNWLRDFAKSIGNGRCNNRGYNCVNGVLEMCKQEAEGDDVTPMYYMACAAMLGKMGERDCAEGRPSCAGHLQGAVYFSLRAAAGCHKSFEKNKPRQAEADKLIERFAKTVNQNVKGVYVKHVEEAQTVTHHLVWHAGKEAGIIGTEKVLEFAFERLAWHTAGGVVSSVGLPLFVFSSMMLFHEIAASEMNNLVCLEWGHYYGGSYANAGTSITRMTSTIK